MSSETPLIEFHVVNFHVNALNPMKIRFGFVFLSSSIVYISVFVPVIRCTKKKMEQTSYILLILNWNFQYMDFEFKNLTNSPVFVYHCVFVVLFLKLFKNIKYTFGIVI